MKQIERWDLYEIELGTIETTNPFVDVALSADFRVGNRVVPVEAFWDNPYKVRFMPDEIGTWSYTTRSDRPELDGLRGEFECVAPSKRQPRPGKRLGPLSLCLRRWYALPPHRYDLLRLDPPG